MFITSPLVLAFTRYLQHRLELRSVRSPRHAPNLPKRRVLPLPKTLKSRERANRNRQGAIHQSFRRYESAYRLVQLYSQALLSGARRPSASGHAVLLSIRTSKQSVHAYKGSPHARKVRFPRGKCKSSPLSCFRTAYRLDINVNQSAQRGVHFLLMSSHYKDSWKDPSRYVSRPMTILSYRLPEDQWLS